MTHRKYIKLYDNLTDCSCHTSLTLTQNCSCFMSELNSTHRNFWAMSLINLLIENYSGNQPHLLYRMLREDLNIFDYRNHCCNSCLLSNRVWFINNYYWWLNKYNKTKNIKKGEKKQVTTTTKNTQFMIDYFFTLCYSSFHVEVKGKRNCLLTEMSIIANNIYKFICRY